MKTTAVCEVDAATALLIEIWCGNKLFVVFVAFRNIKVAFVRPIVILDETWSRHYMLETKHDFKQRRQSCSPQPEKAILEAICGNVIGFYFLEYQKYSIVDYFPRGGMLAVSTFK